MNLGYKGLYVLLGMAIFFAIWFIGERINKNADKNDADKNDADKNDD